jgi:dihydropteroate synthase
MIQRKKFELKWKNHSLGLGEKTRIMGILNVTPDSFSDGGLFYQGDQAVNQGELMAAQGADILDIGGESTRPSSEAVSSAEEISRVIPVIAELVKRISIPISIDTRKAEVAKAALEAGASIVNDISALSFDPEMGRLIAAHQVPVILMHMQGTPRDMQHRPHYQNLLEEVHLFFQERLEAAGRAGIPREMVLLDPGIGFGKNTAHNLTLIRRLDFFQKLNRPLVLGTSRKSFIGKITGQEPPDRDWGTAATLTVGVGQGAHLVRVHNVAAARDCLAVTDALYQSAAP